jgi:hypothetical protein
MLLLSLFKSDNFEKLPPPGMKSNPEDSILPESLLFLVTLLGSIVDLALFLK